MAKAKNTYLEGAKEMETLIKGIPTHMEAGLEIGRTFVKKHKFKGIRKVLFYGMGGSAIGGDLLRSIVTDRSTMFLSVYRQGRWSRWTDSETLVIFSSYSGNTAEILEVFS